MTNLPFTINTQGLDETAIFAHLEALTHFARPVASHFQVATLAVDEKGIGYAGVNLEFEGLGFSQTIHAEQFAINWARINFVQSIKTLYVSQWPCGHCRQFILESPVEKIVTPQEPNKTFKANELLPHAFHIPNQKGHWWIPENHPEKSSVEALCKWAAHSSAKGLLGLELGVVLEDKKGQQYWGSLIENSAFNPSLSPLQSALSHYWAKNCVEAGPVFDDIQAIYFHQNNTEENGPTLNYQIEVRAFKEAFLPKAKLIILE